MLLSLVWMWREGTITREEMAVSSYRLRPKHCDISEIGNVAPEQPRLSNNESTGEAVSWQRAIRVSYLRWAYPKPRPSKKALCV